MILELLSLLAAAVATLFAWRSAHDAKEATSLLQHIRDEDRRHEEIRRLERVMDRVVEVWQTAYGVDELRIPSKRMLWSCHALRAALASVAEDLPQSRQLALDPDHRRAKGSALKAIDEVEAKLRTIVVATT